MGDLVVDGEGPRNQSEVALSVSDPTQLQSLKDWLRGQGVSVAQSPGVPGPGEQGVLDALTVLAGSSGLVAAVRVLPEFLRSRRSGLRIETTVNGERFTLDATNVEQVLPILERLLK